MIGVESVKLTIGGVCVLGSGIVLSPALEPNCRNSACGIKEIPHYQEKQVTAIFKNTR